MTHIVSILYYSQFSDLKHLNVTNLQTQKKNQDGWQKPFHSAVKSK